MQIIKRKRRLAIIGVVYLLSAAVYLIIAFSSCNEFGLLTHQCILLGLLGGWLMAGSVTGIFMCSDFIKNKTFLFKILACILFPFTIILTLYAGILGGIPYIIYNITTAYARKSK